MYGRFTYIHHKNQLNVGKYASPMDPLGKDWSFLLKSTLPETNSSHLPEGLSKRKWIF